MTKKELLKEEKTQEKQRDVAHSLFFDLKKKSNRKKKEIEKIKQKEKNKTIFEKHNTIVYVFA